jgi:lipoate-protein ligase A
MNAYYLCSPNSDPFYNLTVEEYMLDHLQENTLLLFLWQGDNAVAIGRHQNPWKETDAAFMMLNNIALARRISGGGAVYLDRGNLNFSFIADQRLFDADRQLRAVSKSLLEFEIDSTIGKRKGLFVSGKKFSGSAFAYRHGRALHHGTLLISTDLDMMRALQGRVHIARQRGTLSEHSEMINLSMISPAISVEGAAGSLRHECEREFGYRFQKKEICDLCETAAISALYEKYASWEWRYGATPPFDAEFKRDGAGISVHVDKGCVGRVVLLPEGDMLLDAEGTLPFHVDEVKNSFKGINDPRVSLIGNDIF